MGVHTVAHILMKKHMKVFKDVNIPWTKFSSIKHKLLKQSLMVW